MKKGSKMTEEQRKRVSEAHKGKAAWNKGKKGIYSEETKRKMREGRDKAWSNPELSKRQSILTKVGMANPEIRKKISESGKGRIPWNKDKKMPEMSGEKHSMFGKNHSEEAKRKMSEASKIRWQNLDYKKRMSEVHLGKPSGNKGKSASAETRRKLSESHKGQTTWIKGKHHTKETRKRLRESSLKAWTNPEIRKILLEANRRRYLDPESLEKIIVFSRTTILKLYESGAFPKQTDTKPERQIKEELVKRGYKEGEDFIHQYKFMNKFMCDFCFPQQKLIIEVDGDFWHANPKKFTDQTNLHPHQIKGMNRDKSKSAYISKADNGSWTLIRIWESDINKDIAECLNKIEKVLAEKRDIKTFVK